MTAPVYIPTDNIGVFPFLHTLSSIFFYGCFIDGQSDQYKVIPACSVNLFFSDSDVEHHFMCLFVICISSLEKSLFMLSHLGWGDFVVINIIEWYELFVYFGN